MVIKRIVRKVLSNKTLYYPGCMNLSITTDIDKNYREILKKLGVDFVIVNDLLCSGHPVRNAGYKDEFERIKGKNIEILDRFGISRIITSCPGSFKAFKQDYLLEENGIEVMHIYEVIAKNVGKIKDKFKKGGAPRITFHDSCTLGRHCGIYDEPRKILLAAGYGLEEFPKKKETAECCGACGGVKANFPKVANDIAKQRLKQAKTNVIVTASPSCYIHLKQNSIDNKEVYEVSHLINDAIL